MAETIEELLFRLSADFADLRRDFDEARRMVERNNQRMRREFGQLDRSMQNLSRTADLAKRALAAIGVVALVRDIVNAQLAFERINQTLRFATGSAEDAARAYEFVRQAAERLGLDLQVAADGYSSLAAAAKSTSLAGQEAQALFLAVSEASAVLQLNASQTERVFTALVQMISKGTVSAEEMRQQLGEQLVSAFQLAAESVGATTKEFSELLGQGQIVAEDFLPRFARRLHEVFGPEVAQAARSTQAEINRFNTTLFELKLAFAQSGFLDGLVDAMKELSRVLRDPSTQEGLREFGQTLGALLSFIARNSDKVIPVLAALAGLRTGAAIGRAVGGLRGGLIGGGVGALLGLGGSMLLDLGDDAEETAESTDRLAESFAALNTELGDLTLGGGSLDESRAKLIDHRAAVEAETEALNRLAEAWSASSNAGMRADQGFAAEQQLANLGADLGPSRRSALRDALVRNQQAQSRVQQAQTLTQYREENDLLEVYIDLIKEGAASLRDLEDAQKLYNVTRAAGTDEGSAFAESLAEQILRARELAAALAALREVQSARGNLEAAQAELALLDETRAVRDRELALLRTRQRLIEQGIDLQSEEAQEVLRLAALQAETTAAIEEQNQRMQEARQFARDFAAALESGFEDAILQGESLRDVIDGLILDLSRLTLRQVVVRPLFERVSGVLEGQAGGLFGRLFGSARGNVLAGGRVQPFQQGGVIDRPILFPMANGTGLAGEAGPEGILPLKRGPDGRLGVAAHDVGSRPVVITFNVQASDAASFRRSETQIAAMLSRAMDRGARNL